MFIKSKYLGISALAIASACSSSGGSTPETPMNIYQGYRDTADAANGIAPTLLTDMPTSGTATYTGHIGAALGTADMDVGLAADLSLQANFQAKTITGAATNLRILDDQGGVHNYAGQFTLVNGIIERFEMSADLNGAATGDFGGGLSIITPNNLDLTGKFRSVNGTADVVSGDLVGALDLSVGATIHTLGAGFGPQPGGFYACTVDCSTVITIP